MTRRLDHDSALSVHLHAKLGMFRSWNEAMLPAMREAAREAEERETAAFEIEWKRYEENGFK